MRGHAAVPVTRAAQAVQRGTILGSGRGVVYVGFPSGVVALTSKDLPAMPNGIIVEASHLPPVRSGNEATLGPGILMTGATALEWEHADAYDLVATAPRRNWQDAPRPAPLCDDLARGLRLLARGLVTDDEIAVGAATRWLLGRGRGLTPEGDDLVAGAAATAFALGIDQATIAACVPDDLDSRTTMLSGTLLRLATQGRVIEPLLRVLSDDAASLERAAWRLTKVGSSTGHCYLHATMSVVEAFGEERIASVRTTPREEVTH